MAPFYELGIFGDPTEYLDPPLLGILERGGLQRFPLGPSFEVWFLGIRVEGGVSIGVGVTTAFNQMPVAFVA